MIHHCRAVARAVKGAFLVADLPMGSYEISPEHAIKSAIRLIQEGRVHVRPPPPPPPRRADRAQAVKLEGGAEMAPTIRRLTQLGIAVVAHVGLTPQRAASLGGFRVQGKSLAGARALLADARAVQAAGAFCIVVEAVPAEIAARVTRLLAVPTIGIGAGAGTSGQVLVQVDMLGYFPAGRFLPKFVKQYGDMFGVAQAGIAAFGREVRASEYPQPQHTYPMAKEELEATRAFFDAQEAPGADGAPGAEQ